MQIEFHPAARIEFEEAAAFYEERARGLGGEFADEVRGATERLRAHPESGFSVGRGTRRYQLKRFPFSLLYQTQDERLRILAVMHHRRKPGYWTGRE